MRNLIVKMRTGYCGEDAYDILQVPSDFTDEQIDQIAFEMAIDHASSYGREVCSEDCEDPDCELEHIGNTNIEGAWQDYIPEKHDMYRSGGGSFAKDFKI